MSRGWVVTGAEVILGGQQVEGTLRPSGAEFIGRHAFMSIMRAWLMHNGG